MQALKGDLRILQSLPIFYTGHKNLKLLFLGAKITFIFVQVQWGVILVIISGEPWRIPSPSTWTGRLKSKQFVSFSGCSNNHRGGDVDEAAAISIAASVATSVAEPSHFGFGSSSGSRISAPDVGSRCKRSRLNFHFTSL